MRKLVLLLVIPLCLLAANFKLYLKDGGYHLVREYKVEGDRVRFYSVERSDWEEMPVDLVDVKKTENELKQRRETLAEESKIIAAEEKLERELLAQASKVPVDPGVYLIDGNDLKTLKAAESKVRTNKGRSVLKVLAPIPIVTGKATLEIDGEKSATKATGERPEFYIRLSENQRFGLVRLRPEKGVRIVEKITIVPVTNEKVEEQEEVETYRQQLDDGLYKIWPIKPLPAGEYAVVEFTEGKLNIQVWDFSFEPSKQ
jgi:hypothetical protein